MDTDKIHAPQNIFIPEYSSFFRNAAGIEQTGKGIPPGRIRTR